MLARPVLMVDIPFEDVGDDLLSQVRMKPELLPVRHHGFGESVERQKGTLLGRGQEESGGRFGDVQMTRSDCYSSSDSPDRQRTSPDARWAQVPYQLFLTSLCFEAM